MKICVQEILQNIVFKKKFQKKIFLKTFFLKFFQKKFPKIFFFKTFFFSNYFKRKFKKKKISKTLFFFFFLPSLPPQVVSRENNPRAGGAAPEPPGDGPVPGEGEHQLSWRLHLVRQLRRQGGALPYHLPQRKTDHWRGGVLWESHAAGGGEGATCRHVQYTAAVVHWRVAHVLEKQNFSQQNDQKQDQT